MRILAIALLVVAAAVPARGAGEDPPLEKDARLAKKVTLRLKKSALSEVLAELGRQVGVRLTAAAGVADEPAVVYATEQPAAEVMRQLASLFDYRWARTGSVEKGRYELYQDREGARREEELRQ